MKEHEKEKQNIVMEIKRSAESVFASIPSVSFAKYFFLAFQKLNLRLILTFSF